MNVEKEIEQLKYQIKLLKFMVNADDFPFYMYALDHNFSENQVNALMKVLLAMNYRLNQNADESLREYHEFNKNDDQLKSLLHRFGIEINEIYKEELPSITEFKHYIHRIFAQNDINAKHLLLSLERQHYGKLCEYLLHQLEDK